MNKERAGVLAVGTVLLLFLGLIYAYSVLLAPLKVEFGWSVSQMTLVFALSICSFTVGSLGSGPLVSRGREGLGLLIGAAMLAVGFLGSAFASGSAALYVVYSCYGVVASGGIGLVYNIVIPTVTSWFQDKPGIAQGLCLMGFGAGGFVLGPVATWLYSVASWRVVLTGFAFVFALLVLASSVVMRAPSDEQLRQILAAAAKKRGNGSVSTASDASTAEMLRTRRFWLLYAFLFMLGSIGMGVTGIGRELPLSLGADDFIAALVIGFVNIGSGTGRLLCGVALDRLGRGRAMRVIGVGGLIAPFVMLGSLWLGSLPLQAVACLLTGMAWGAAVVTMPYVSRTEWGQANMAQNMAVVNTYSIFASIAGSWGAGLLVSATGSFVPVLVIMACLGAASVALSTRM